MIGAQQFRGMAEADALGPHDPIDGRSADVALAHAAPQVGFRRHDQRRRAVVMEGAASHQVRPAPFNSTPKPVTRRSMGISFFSRSISSSGIRAISEFPPKRLADAIAVKKHMCYVVDSTWYLQKSTYLFPLRILES